MAWRPRSRAAAPCPSLGLGTTCIRMARLAHTIGLLLLLAFAIGPGSGEEEARTCFDFRGEAAGSIDHECSIEVARRFNAEIATSGKHFNDLAEAFKKRKLYSGRSPGPAVLNNNGWRRGHACPKRPGTAEKPATKRGGDVENNPEDKGWNLFAQTNKDNGWGRHQPGLGPCLVSCDEADFYGATHVLCNPRSERGEDACVGYYESNVPGMPGCGACVESSNFPEDPLCTPFKRQPPYPFRLGGAMAAAGALNFFEGFRNGTAGDTIVGVAVDGITNLITRAINTASGQAGRAASNYVEQLYVCGNEICRYIKDETGKFVGYAVQQGLASAGRMVTGSMKEEAMIYVNSAAVTNVGKGAASLVSRATGTSAAFSTAATGLACQPVLVTAGVGVAAVGVYNVVRANQKLTQVQQSIDSIEDKIDSVADFLVTAFDEQTKLITDHLQRGFESIHARFDEQKRDEFRVTIDKLEEAYKDLKYEGGEQFRSNRAKSLEASGAHLRSLANVELKKLADKDRLLRLPLYSTLVLAGRAVQDAEYMLHPNDASALDRNKVKAKALAKAISDEAWSLVHVSDGEEPKGPTMYFLAVTSAPVLAQYGTMRRALDMQARDELPVYNTVDAFAFAAAPVRLQLPSHEDYIIWDDGLDAVRFLCNYSSSSLPNFEIDFSAPTLLEQERDEAAQRFLESTDSDPETAKVLLQQIRDDPEVEVNGKPLSRYKKLVLAVVEASQRVEWYREWVNGSFEVPDEGKIFVTPSELLQSLGCPPNPGSTIHSSSESVDVVQEVHAVLRAVVLPAYRDSVARKFGGIFGWRHALVIHSTGPPKRAHHRRGEEKKSEAMRGEDPRIMASVKLLRSGTDRQQEAALYDLWRLALNDRDNQAAIAMASGIEPLVALVRSGTERQKVAAARAIGTLSLWLPLALETLEMITDNQAAIARAGGIEPLVALVRSGTDRQKEAAAWALGNLAMNTDNQAAIARAGGIEPLVALVRIGTERQKNAAAETLGNLAMNTDNQAAVARAGGIEPLVALVRSSAPQYGRVWWVNVAGKALWTLASNTDNKAAIVNAGCSWSWFTTGACYC